MKRVLTALFLATTLSLTGCVTIGKTFPVDQIAHIQDGVTTRTEIEKMFGQPWRVGMDAGLHTWTYAHYRYALFGDSKTRDLVIRFDKNGKVVNFTFNSTYREDESKM